MNEIKRLRLQNQIFRHVALFFQKTTPSQSAKMTLAETQEQEKIPNPFELAGIEDITRQVQDYVTFTRCELSADGSFAKLFVSVWGSPREQERLLKDIRQKVPALRTSIAKNIRMRAIPQIVIVQDTSFEKASEVDKLMR
ncbi:MAG: ribosome-binding factor A [Spirochaetota bacterium]